MAGRSRLYIWKIESRVGDREKGEISPEKCHSMKDFKAELNLEFILMVVGCRF